MAHGVMDKALWLFLKTKPAVMKNGKRETARQRVRERERNPGESHLQDILKVTCMGYPIPSIFNYCLLIIWPSLFHATVCCFAYCNKEGRRERRKAGGKEEEMKQRMRQGEGGETREEGAGHKGERNSLKC